MLDSPGHRNHKLPHFAESFLLMGTVVTIRVVGTAKGPARKSIGRSIAAMTEVERQCSRFDEASALRHLCRHPGELVPVPPALFHALRIACEMGALTGGVFDPTVGRPLEQMGFNRHYLTQEAVESAGAGSPHASYRDITLFEDTLSVRLQQPLMLDLGGVAKGLAVDLGAQALQDFEGFAIDAGGDVYVHGLDPSGELWDVGIEHPKRPDSPIRRLRVSDMAVCTSGSYKRRSPLNPGLHHLWNPITQTSAQGLLSCTVAAPLAVLADASATAAFLSGPQQAMDFIEKLGLAGFAVTEDWRTLETASMRRYMR